VAIQASEVERAASRALGELLRTRRLAKALSQERLANEIGINRNYYQQMESGISQRNPRTPANPTFLMLMRLSEVLDVPVGQLVDEAIEAGKQEIRRRNGE
jgi:transcriptional regulator with XRE-family HTH domain